jgi:hypothetical protein
MTQNTEYVLVKRRDLRAVVDAADAVVQWDAGTWLARNRLHAAAQIDGSGAV